MNNTSGGVWARIKAVFSAQANELVDSIEDPRTSLNYSQVKLEETSRDLSRSLVEVMAARRQMETQRAALSDLVERHGSQASEAVKAGKEDLARAALARRIEAQERRDSLEVNLATLEGQIETLKQSQASLNRKVQAFQARKEELKSMYASSQAQLRVRESISGLSRDLAAVGNTVRRIEERIQAMRARSEAIDNLVAEGLLVDVLAHDDDIDQQLAQLKQKQAVETELARLKGEG